MSFKEEQEGSEALDQVLRAILKVTHFHVEQGLGQGGFELMITFNPHFQMKLNEAIDPAHTYEYLSKRSIHGWPWFSLSSQKEDLKVWSWYT